MDSQPLNLTSELFAALEVISQDENLMRKAVRCLKKLVKSSSKDNDYVMTKEEFYANIAEAEHEIESGKGTTFTNLDDMNNWLNAL